MMIGVDHVSVVAVDSPELLVDEALTEGSVVVERLVIVHLIAVEGRHSGHGRLLAVVEVSCLFINL